jgi:FkbM family methyltransferase
MTELFEGTDRRSVLSTVGMRCNLSAMFAGFAARILRTSVRVARTRFPRVAPLLDRHSQAPLPLRVAPLLFSDRQLREVAYSVLEKEGVRLHFQRGDLRWTVDAGDSVGRGLFVEGAYEREAIEALIRWAEKTGRPKLVIDVGANVGTTSIPFANAGFDVLAVEPVPLTFAMLEANVQENGLEGRVRCIKRAVAKTAGTVEMWTTRGSGLSEVAVRGESPVFTRTGRQAVDLIDVEGAGLAEIVDEAHVRIDHVGLVWCDAQGSETHVLESGRQLWEAGVPIYLEIDRENLERHGGLARFLECAEQYFATFLSSRALTNAQLPTPIRYFRDLVDSVPWHQCSNALLIP